MKEQVIVPKEQLVLRHRRDGRAVYSAEGKRALVQACIGRRDVSVAGLALARGINANVLRRWIRRSRAPLHSQNPVEPSHAPNALVPVALVPASAVATVDEQRIAAAALVRVQLYGATVELSGGVDRTALSAVLDCLRAHAAAP